MKTSEKLIKTIGELDSIPGLYKFVMENGFCAGGAIRDLERDVTPKDYDIFFKTKEAIEEFKARFSSQMIESALGNYDFQSQENTKFQFITIYYGTPEKVISTFDWNVNQQYHDFGTGKSQKFNTLYNKELRLNCEAQYPLSALLRLPYLLEKGFKITPRELAFVTVFVTSRGCLTSSEKAEQELKFVPSSGSDFSMKNIPERAMIEALKHSPLAQVMKEHE